MTMGSEFIILASLNDDDILRQCVIMELMSNFSLDIKRVEEKFNINFNMTTIDNEVVSINF